MLELTPMRPAFLICFLILAGMLLGEATPPAASTPTAVCTSGVGPGIPPPANVPSGLPGFHAAWYGQSGYPILCPGERATATVASTTQGRSAGCAAAWARWPSSAPPTRYPATISRASSAGTDSSDRLRL